MRVTSLFSLLVGLTIPIAAFAQGEVSVERGLQVSITGGCHGCHTEGYTDSEGKIDPAKAMKGSSIGLRGPWGTTYPSNLRLIVHFMPENGFVKFAKARKRQPMPWYIVRAMDENDIRSLYRYLKSLGEGGDLGEEVPGAIGPDQEPKTPYITVAPPTIPKSNGN